MILKSLKINGKVVVSSGKSKLFLIDRAPLVFLTLMALSAIGFFLGSRIQLKLSLTDLLPDNHPAVVKFTKLTEVVGGVGYLAIVLEAEDGKSHLAAAPKLAESLQKSPLVKSVFYHREQRYFVDRLLYYLEVDKLRELDSKIHNQVTKAKRKVFDIGLWEDEAPAPAAFEGELKDLAKKSAGISPFLTSKDMKHLLVMVKPSFDSMDMGSTEKLVQFAEVAAKEALPENVSYDFGERYYNKVVETKMIQQDIYLLGLASISLIMLTLLLYLRTFKGLIVIFAPVFMGIGITMGLAYLLIGHINIVTGFLMGIISGLGVDYGIHLLLRLNLEKTEPSSDEPNLVWRTLQSSGHSVFVGAIAAAVAFFLLGFSSFRAFSEFGIICGIGILAVFFCLMGSFSPLVKLLKLDSAPPLKKWNWRVSFPVLPLPKGLWFGTTVSVLLILLGYRVGFEYDFDKMMRHSEKMEKLSHLIDDIYDRSNTPSAIATENKEEAIAVEKTLKDRYMTPAVPKEEALVSEFISGATIVPEAQVEKQKILEQIQGRLHNIKDSWIEESLDVPAASVRGWLAAKPFTFQEIPSHVQDALRGTKQSGYLLYIYPAIKLSTATGVHRYAGMIRQIEKEHPTILTGSDAVVFADILDLISRGGGLILAIIFVAVGVFIWVNVRNPRETLLSYLPLIVALPIGMGLMAIFGVKFNIFNIAIIPSFVAMGIDVPIHIVHRAKEIRSGYKAARDLAASINLALLTAAMGFGILIFARAGVLKSLGWVSLLGTAAIWWVGLFLLPAFLEWRERKSTQS